MEEEEHEVYGAEIPDEGEMEADVEMPAADDDAASKVNYSFNLIMNMCRIDSYINVCKRHRICSCLGIG